MGSYKVRTIEGAYEVFGKFSNEDGIPVVSELRSAFMRREVVELTVERMANGIHVATARVVGRWKNYEEARAECEAFNKVEWDKYEQENAQIPA